MASVKELRTRIASLQSTQKITKAMQMVAAAKLRRAQETAQNARPYAQRMAGVIANLAAGVSGDGAPRLLVGTGRDRRHLLIIATSDRGLAGGFNAQIVRLAREYINGLTAEGKEVSLLVVGRKARDQLRRQHREKIVAFYEAGAPTLASAAPIAAKITELFDEGKVDVATLIYSRFHSVVSQTPVARQIIPAAVDADSPKIDLKGAAYEYEPDEESILTDLLPRNLTVQVLAALLENNAGFFAAQMTAMDNATRNAGDLINSLNIVKNRTRQAQITKELIEIISGAEAL
jgi:F-type H+-transporting ATPase subunit gamma